MIYILKIIQIIFDFLLIVLSFFLAYFLRLSIYLLLEWKNTIIHSDYPINNYLIYSWIVWAVMISIYIYQWRYAIDKPYNNFINNFVSSIIWITVFVLIYFYNKEVFFSRLIPIYILFISYVLLYINNIIFRKIYSLKQIRESFWRRTLIIWANINTENLIKSLKNNNSIRQIIWIIDAYWTKKKEISWIKVLWKMNKFEQIINDFKIDEIIQTDNQEQTLNIVTFCENRWISYFQVPSLSSWLFHENLEVYYLDEKPIIYLNQSNLNSWNLIFKKILDLLFSVILIPLFCIIWLFQLLRWRNILLTEKRISSGKIFAMYRFWVNETNIWEDKLATDNIEENSKISFIEKLKNKSIKTSFIDKMIIKSWLIELPQILNVLKWEMSIVWPRPPFEKEYINYQEYYKKRLTIKPWITWLWQIKKSKENYSFDSMLKTDVEYINKWSFYLDFKILLITLLKKPISIIKNEN